MTHEATLFWKLLKHARKYVAEKLGGALAGLNLSWAAPVLKPSDTDG